MDKPRKYKITKSVMARSCAEALQKERNGEITDIWLDDKSEKKEDTNVVGFKEKE